MIKLGKLTDYAIAVMGQLVHEAADSSAQGEGTMSSSAHYLSSRTGIPEPTIAKVLKMLAKGGLVVSARGAAGGYRLAKPAGQISIGEIIAVMDGPVAIVSCVDPGQEPCMMSETCPTRHGWSRVNDAIKSALDGVKLTEMLSAPACGKVHDFMKGEDAGCA
ncbi:MAG: Rrf2 family transcriptional regulator [Alphaproteobacteria bacterium]|nr:Rrf2 family transcriptional regulator [Alphaproteobacteria bacterium]MDE2335729.1 Rrf2 family transcriptional regulator [Alphaproteobacteria bacterium]